MDTLARDPYLYEVFNDPTRDLFNEVGERLYGPRAVGNKELRIRTKAYVYGTAYGREEFSVAAEFGITVAEAKKGMNTWFAMIPDLIKWRDGVRDEVLNQTGDLTTSFGRRRRFWLITRENKKDVIKEAYSYYPQSTASDICLSALIALRPRLAELGAEIRIPVHDSILVECDRSRQGDVARILKEEMEDAATRWSGGYVPFPVEVEAGSSWGDLSA